MHRFDELVDHCAQYTLASLGDVQAKVLEALETSGATRYVKALQMIQLQKAILAIGMFSMFDARLQDQLGHSDGFRRAEELLNQQGDKQLVERFEIMQMAINVLKHGGGRSYDALVGKTSALPFRIKRPNESFFNEGDVSEIATLIDVDDAFVRLCATTIREVAEAIRRSRHK